LGHPSGGYESIMAIEFSAESKKEIAELTTRYPNKQAVLLPALHIAQKDFGFIGDECVHLVAAELGVPASLVQEVATFYSLYNRKPVGEYIIQVCQTLSCALRGAYSIIHLLEQRLGIALGETTADGKFTLVTAECLASCGTAPMFQVTARDYSLNAYYENLTEARVDEVLAELRARPPIRAAADMKPLTTHTVGEHHG
jgi:NADH-quinone oxidoreductase E subunit